MGVRRSSLRSLFFSLFRAPVGRLFGRPLLLSSVTPWPALLPPGLFFTLCAVRRSSRRLFCHPTSASGTFMSAGLRPPFLGLLVPDRSLPWPPCAWVASLAALCAAFLAALWASSLTARCAACLAARRAGSLAAQCAAYFAARRAACFAARCTTCFAARCTTCFAARCTTCFAARCSACFAAQCDACFTAQCDSCFTAQCDACFTARGVACLAAPCAASLAASCAAFAPCRLLPRSAGRLLGRSGRTSLRQRGFPSATPLQGCPLFLLPFRPSLSHWPPPYTGFSTSLFLFRSRLRVALSSWVLHTSVLTGMGTWAPRVLPPPSGTFRLLETRQYVTTD